MKKRIGIAALFVVAVGLLFVIGSQAKQSSGLGESEDVRSDLSSFNGYGNESSSYTLRFTSSGHIIPGDFDRGADLGSSNRKFRAIYVSSAVFDDQQTVGTGANISTRTATRSTYSRNTFLGFEPLAGIGVAIASSGVTIVPTGSYMEITSTGGPISMTATPNISTANAKPGDILLIRSSTISVSFQDRGTLANSGVSLGSTARTLSTNDTLWLIFGSSQSTWAEFGTANNQP